MNENNLNEGQNMNPQQEVLNNLNAAAQSTSTPVEKAPAPKKGGSGLVIFLVIVILGLGGFVAYDKLFKESPKGESTTTKKQEKNSVKEETEKKDLDLVYSYKDETLKEKGKGCTDEFKHVYKIPQIKINSDEVNKINKEILDAAQKLYDTDLNAYNADSNLDGCRLNYAFDYEYIIKDDTLTLLTYSYSTLDESTDYGIYNINTKTNGIVTNAEILKSKGLTEETFKTKLTDAFKVVEKELVDMGAGEYAGPTVQANLSNFENTPADKYSMYLDIDNNLNVEYSRVNLAGAEKSNFIINIDKNKYVKTYQELIK